MDPITAWTSEVCSDLGIDTSGLDGTTVTRAARDVQRVVAKPAAPYTIYLLGVAVGRGLPAEEATTRLAALTRKWRGIDWRD